MHNVKAIDSFKFVLFGFGCTSHTAELCIHAEEVLEGDCGKSLVFTADDHSFLCFDCLVQAFVVSSANHDTAREFINDEHFAVVDDIVTVTLHHIVSLQGLLDMMIEFGVVYIGEVVKFEIFFRLLHALVGEHNRLFLFFNGEVVVFTNCAGKCICGLVHFTRLSAPA